METRGDSRLKIIVNQCYHSMKLSLFGNLISIRVIKYNNEEKDKWNSKIVEIGDFDELPQVD